MSITRIRDALNKRLAAMSPALATAWEGKPYTPTAGTPWQRVTLHPARPEWLGSGAGSTYRDVGFLQVDLFYPQATGDKGQGTDAVLARAELLLAQFWPAAASGLWLTESGLTVRIKERPELGRVMETDGWLMCPVTIRYFAEIFPS